MRVILVGDTNIDVRGLTGKEIKKLQAEGIPVSRLNIDVVKLAQDLDLAEETMDKVLDTVLTDEQKEILDDQPNKQILKVWGAVVKETWGAPDEEKNSSRSGPGPQTQTE